MPLAHPDVGEDRISIPKQTWHARNREKTSKTALDPEELFYQKKQRLRPQVSCDCPCRLALVIRTKITTIARLQ